MDGVGVKRRLGDGAELRGGRGNVIRLSIIDQLISQLIKMPTVAV